MTISTQSQRGPTTTPATSPLILRSTFHLYLAFAMYIVVPLIDLPMLPLSMSAPILFLVFPEVFLKRSDIRLGDYAQWLGIAYLFWIALLVSLTVSAIFNETSITNANIILAIRYTYWMIVFLTTIVIVSSIENLNQLGFVMATGILIVTGMRLFEAAFWGQWGGSNMLRFMTQNVYGIQFSTFTSYAVALLFVFRGHARNLAVITLPFIIITISGNGSRSSWIAVLASVLTFLFLISVTQENGLKRAQTWIIIVAGLLLVAVTVVPSSALDPILERYDTFNTLERDKPYVIRQLMIQKAQKLFEEHPVFGIGIGQFTKTSIELDIPDVLKFVSSDPQHYFNRFPPHNSYMVLAAETGLIGLIPFGILHFWLLFQGSRAVINLARRGEIWPIAIFSGYIGMSIHYWTLTGLAGTNTWFVYGLVAALIKRAKRLRKAENTP